MEIGESMASKAVTNHTMNGGEGLHSYSKNSSFQGQVVDQIRGLIESMVDQTLNIDQLSLRRTFRVVDNGCSTGPNTFFAIEMIIEAVEKKYRAKGLANELPEFHVFFNDRPTNDFNTLFRNLPSDKKYYAAGVPGSFLGRLFPDNFIDFVYSSYSLHWLSVVPKSVLDRQSPAFNKAKIHYGDAKKEVGDAFAMQFHTEMNKFLDARAQEVVTGGMMALTIRGRTNGTSHHQLVDSKFLGILGSCLLDMAEKGTITEEKVDDFNIPLYYGTPREIESIVRQNDHFDIDKMEIVTHGKEIIPDQSTFHMAVANWRALIEGLLVEHFGEEATQEIFQRWRKKLEELSVLDAETGIEVVILLKRNHINN